jgi:hypothetical protein
MLFDSAFLIHLSGQRGSRDKAAAERFLATHPDASLYTSRICWAEFAERCNTPREVEAALHLFAVIELDERVAWSASRIGRDLGGISATTTSGLPRPPLSSAFPW